MSQIEYRPTSINKALTSMSAAGREEIALPAGRMKIGRGARFDRRDSRIAKGRLLDFFGFADLLIAEFGLVLSVRRLDQIPNRLPLAAGLLAGRTSKVSVAAGRPSNEVAKANFAPKLVQSALNCGGLHLRDRTLPSGRRRCSIWRTHSSLLMWR